MKQTKNIIFVLSVMIAVLIVSAAAVNAQETAAPPAYTITSVTPGSEVVVMTKDFPADKDFIVQMRELGTGDPENVAKFNSGTGGAFSLALTIPASLKNAQTIEITLMSMNNPTGFSISAQFANGGTGGKVDCSYSVAPTFGYDAVLRNSSITVTTKDFPANSKFKVKMGVLTGGVIARQMIEGYATYELPQPYYDWTLPILNTPDYYAAPYAYNYPDPVVPACWPTGQDCAYKTVTMPGKGTIFSGIEVGEYDSLDGSPQTVSYPIPTELKDVSPIIVRFEDQGPCGIYSFNYFWNADYPVSTTNVPTVDIVPAP